MKQAFLKVNESRLSSKNELIVFCPKHYHHKPKLEINIENDIYNCWVCGNSGRVPKLLRQATRIDLARSYMEIMGWHQPESESESWGILVPPRGLYGASLSGAQREVIKTKISVTDSDIIKGNIGLSTDEQYIDRIVFPSFDENGKVNYFLTRSLSDFGIKYIAAPVSPKSIIFNELYINWSKPIVLTESVKTHFKMIDCCNFVPILGSKLYEDSRILQEMVLNRTKEVTLMFDSDAQEKQIAAAKTLIKLGIRARCATLPGGTKQPDELNCDEILDVVDRAVSVESTKDLLKMKVANRI